VPKFDSKVNFLGLKGQLKVEFLGQKVYLSQEVDFKYRFFDLKWLDSHSFDGFKGSRSNLEQKLKTISTSLIISYAKSKIHLSAHTFEEQETAISLIAISKKKKYQIQALWIYPKGALRIK